MNAPVCPINRSQPTAKPFTAPTRLPSIPIATDLPSLVRSVNIIRDILRNITTSLTVNNTYLPRQPQAPKIPPKKNYLMTPYPDWYQVGKTVVDGYVYYKSRRGKDEDQKAYVIRTNAVEFRNISRDDDKSFNWRYAKRLDSDGGSGEPFEEDFFERVVNVKWGTKGRFSFAGYIDFIKIIPGSADAIGQIEVHTTRLGGTSKDGNSWNSERREEGLGFFCCVRGKVEDRDVTVAAGYVMVGPIDHGPGYSHAWGDEPAAGVSYDDGLNWSDAGVPLQEFVLKPPNPETGEGGDVAQGTCRAVAYHPGLQTFYVGATVIFLVGADVYWEDRLYSGKGDSFSEEYSERRELFDAFKGYRWPEVEVTPDMTEVDLLRVADTTSTTKPGPGVLFVVSFSPNQRARYVTQDGNTTTVSVNDDDNGIVLGGNDISIDGMPLVNSVCGGKKHIVAVGWEDEDERVGPVTFVSGDDGLSWHKELEALVTVNPGPDDDTAAGSSSGSCSYCP